MKDLFLKLVQVPSPSGQEVEMISFIKNYLTKAGLKVKFDDWGNVTGEIPGGGKKILLAAHMDTVQNKGELIKPILKDGIIKSNGKTILGADNKAGVTILLSLIEPLKKLSVKPGIWLAFSSREEVGEMSSAKLDTKTMKPDVILNVDGGKQPGIIDFRALGQLVFELVVIGKAAHAAVEPEKGIHAIKIAAEIIRKVDIGRKSNGDTINIGKITGGEATNVVPDKTILKGEVRSFSGERLVKLVDKIIITATKVADKYGGQVQMQVLESVGVPVWEGKKSKKWIKVFERAAVKSGVQFAFSEMQASSDANCLAQSGVPTFCVNRGGKSSHSSSESITLKEMEDSKRFIMEIIKELVR